MFNPMESIATHGRHGNSGKTNGASEGDGDSLLDWVDVLKLLGSRRRHQLLVADIEAKGAIGGLDQRGLEVVGRGGGVATVRTQS